jgi:Flp pilus assembly protein TadG
MRFLKRTEKEQGQTMAEFAVVLPVLMILILGVIQFGIVFNNYITLTDAARAAARKGAVSRESGNPSADCIAAGVAAAADLKQTKLSVSCSSTWKPGADVTVTATYPYRVKLLGFVMKSGNLTTQIKERVE